MSSLVSMQRLVASLTLVAALAAPSLAQCQNGDGLDLGSFCGPAWMQKGQQKFTQPALGICWKDCGVDTTANYTAQWGGLATILSALPPVQNSCGWYRTRILLLQGTTPRWTGVLHLSYSRTWTEHASGGLLQVWRYMVNGDLIPLSATPGPCVTPACAAPNGNKVRFTGYIDYARDCSVPGVFEHAWMLTHGCDSIDHAPGFARAGTYHPDRFYTFVGPSTGFVVGASSTLEIGAAAVEAIRKWDANVAPARCELEEPLLFAAFNPSGTLCLCGVGPALWYEAFFTAAGAYGSTVNPFLGSAPFRSYPIGAWTNPSVFPGLEEVRYNTNELEYVDCSTVLQQDWYYGVTTVGGFAPFSISSLLPQPPPVALPSTFVDQSNSRILPGGFSTRNVPYRSDRILNLNL